MAVFKNMWLWFTGSIDGSFKKRCTSLTAQERAYYFALSGTNKDDREWMKM